MLKTAADFVGRFIDLYGAKRIPRAAAALTYYVTLSFFPMAIALYTMLGSSRSVMQRILNFAAEFLSEKYVSFLSSIFRYIENNASYSMLIAAIMFLLVSASAGLRTVFLTISDMQGEQPLKGIPFILGSLVISVLFMVSIYAAAIIMLMGGVVIAKINNFIPFLDISVSWIWLRFVFLFGIELLMIWAVYGTCQVKSSPYHTLPGALTASVAVVVISMIFSGVVSASVRYQMVYGSLVSLILVMVWMNACGIAIFSGAALNIILRDMKNRKQIEGISMPSDR